LKKKRGSEELERLRDGEGIGCDERRRRVDTML